MAQACRVREEVALKDVLELPVGTNAPRLPGTGGVSVLKPEQLVTLCTSEAGDCPGQWNSMCKGLDVREPVPLGSLRQNMGQQ